jgi:hypothetical protein
MTKHFVSGPLEQCCGGPPLLNEPQLPAAFRWRDQTLQVKNVRARKRSTKVDRGDTYLKRHWFEFDTTDGRIAVVYYDRGSKRGSPHWWLYSIEDAC